MKTYTVRDKQIVVVLNARKTKALYQRLQMHTGVVKSKDLLRAEDKILAELLARGEIR